MFKVNCVLGFNYTFDIILNNDNLSNKKFEHIFCFYYIWWKVLSYPYYHFKAIKDNNTAKNVSILLHHTVYGKTIAHILF